MLKINRTHSKFQKLTGQTLSEANLLERRDLQRMIVNDPDPFFEEMGERLLIIGQEVKPSDHVGDSIDILAIDETGASVIIELKRHEHKLQLLQAISYAAMLTDWDADDFLRQRSAFAQEGNEEALEQIKDHLTGQDYRKEINQRQRIVLVAENFDFALLKSAEWLSEKYGISIRCYRLGLASDGGSEYLSCTCIYPPAEIIEYASRVRRTALPVNRTPASWEQILASTKNAAVRSFFEKALSAGEENRATAKAIFYRVKEDRRFLIGLRTKHAWVLQLGRFENDLDFWSSRLSVPQKIKEVDRGNRLTFNFVTAEDFKKFEDELYRGELKDVQFTEAGGEELGDEAIAEENA